MLKQSPKGNIAAIKMIEHDFSVVIEMLEEGEEIPQFTRSVMVALLRGDVLPNGERWQLKMERPDGKRGKPKRPFSKGIEEITLGSLMASRIVAKGQYDAAAKEVATECGVSERKVKTAYASYKKKLEDHANNSD